MKRYRCGFLALLLLACPLAGRGQLELSLKAEHSALLQFEAMNLFLTVVNDWPHPFVVDAETESSDGVVDVDVIREDGKAVQRVRETPVVPLLRVAPEEKRELAIDVSRWFDVAGMGRYLVKARATRGRLEFESNMIMVEVVRGIELESRTRSLPGAEQELRTFSLRYWTRGKTERLFFRVDDPQNRENYGVFELGRLVRVFKPVLQVRHDGTVRILHQSGVDLYTRSVFNVLSDRVRFIDQTYHRDNGEPYEFRGAP